MTKPKGDCFVAAGRTLLHDKIPELTLVHAIVTGQGELEGKRFPHAWNEVGDVVLDTSNGRKIVMRRKQYYELGKVNTKDPTQYRKYTRKQALDVMKKPKNLSPDGRPHWGPWELGVSLVEAPADYKTLGSFDRPGAFTHDPRDVRLATHPEMAKKVKNFFNRTDYDFNIYAVNIPGLRSRWAEYGEVTMENLQKNIPQLYKVLEANPPPTDSITIFYLGNTGFQKIPFTPWMIAHRFGHALAAGPGNLRISKKFHDLVRMATSRFLLLLNDCYVDLDRRRFHRYTPYFTDLPSRAHYAIFNAIGTMRSARQGKINRPYEFFYELLAQYLNTGDINFNPLPKQIQYGRKAWGRTIGVLKMKLGKEQSAAEQLEIIKDDIISAFEVILGQCPNKIFIM